MSVIRIFPRLLERLDDTGVECPSATSMKKTARPLLATLPLLLGASPAYAAPSDEYRAAFAAMYADPGDLDRTFRFAEIALRDEDFEGAIAALERMLLQSPDLPAVRVQLGELYLRIGSDAQARAYATSALASSSADDGTRREAESLLALLERRESRHRLSGVLTAALGYQTNANSAPSARTVTLRGMSYDLPASDRAQPDGNGFVSAAVDYVYDPHLDVGLTFEATASGSATRQLQVHDYDVVTAGVAAGPRLAPASRPDDGSGAWLYGLADVSTLGGDLYGVGYGGGLAASWPLVSRLWADVVLEATWLDYHDGSVATTASDQSGFAPRGALQLRFRLFDHLGLLAGGHGSTVRARAASQANVAYGGTGGISIQFASPFAGAASPGAIEVVYDQTLARYDEADPDVAPRVVREDTDRRVTAIAQVPLGEHLAAFVSGGYADHPSNLEIYTYRGAFASGGASYGF
jgi:hypothetical protein